MLWPCPTKKRRFVVRPTPKATSRKSKIAAESPVKERVLVLSLPWGKTRMPIFIIRGGGGSGTGWNLNGASIRGKRVTTGRFVLMFRSLRMQEAIQIKDFTVGTTPFSNRFVRAWEEVWVWINLSPLTETLTRAISTKMPSSPCNALDGRFSVTWLRDRQ